jgi:hypothetical protein
MNKPVDVTLHAAPMLQVGVARPHESAALHVAGRAPYTDDLPELAGTLHAALGLSPLAHGVLKAVDVDRLRAMPGVVDVFTASAIPGANDCGPLVHDDPILAGEPGAVLRWRGQPVFAVVATTRDAARRAAARAEDAALARALVLGATPRAARLALAAAGALAALDGWTDGSLLTLDGLTRALRTPAAHLLRACASARALRALGGLAVWAPARAPPPPTWVLLAVLIVRMWKGTSTP